MVKLRKGPGVSSPSSSLGIMRFFDADTKGPKMSPEFVIALSLGLILVVLAARYFLGLS